MDGQTDDDMLAALGVDLAPEEERTYTREEERIIAGFEDIQRFVSEHGHPPRHGEELDIFERLYAVRLDRLRDMPDACRLLASMDTQNLLSKTDTPAPSVEALDDDALLAGLDQAVEGDANDITVLRHVRSHAQRRAAEEIAQRKACPDFDKFKPLFEQVEADIQAGTRETLPFRRDGSTEEGNFFILGGQFAYIADKGERRIAANGGPEARLRVIFSNSTESDLLLTSLIRALEKDEAGRTVTNPDAGPLFSAVMTEEDVATGTIYVLRSHSDEPYIAENRDLIHKIGITGGRVETRIANEAHEPTYLLAETEIVATYRLANINRVKLEKLLHRIFAPAQLDLTIRDRFGNPVQPREWFLVPLPVIDEAVERIMDGTITRVFYD